MRGPDRAVVLDYVRRHPGTDVRRIVSDLYPEASPYEIHYMRGWVSRHLTTLREKGDIVGERTQGSGRMKIWRAVA